MKEVQKVLFYKPDRKDKVFEAELNLIGKSIDKLTKTIPCAATITNNKNDPFRNGMYSECTVITAENESMVSHQKR